MNKTELNLIIEFLNELSDRFGNDVCNDFELNDTPENRRLVKDAELYCDMHERELSIHNNKITTTNFILVDYLKRKLRDFNHD